MMPIGAVSLLVLSTAFAWPRPQDIEVPFTDGALELAYTEDQDNTLHLPTKDSAPELASFIDPIQSGDQTPFFNGNHPASNFPDSHYGHAERNFDSSLDNGYNPNYYPNTYPPNSYGPMNNGYNNGFNAATFGNDNGHHGGPGNVDSSVMSQQFGYNPFFNNPSMNNGHHGNIPESGMSPPFGAGMPYQPHSYQGFNGYNSNNLPSSGTPGSYPYSGSSSGTINNPYSNPNGYNGSNLSATGMNPPYTAGSTNTNYPSGINGYSNLNAPNSGKVNPPYGAGTNWNNTNSGQGTNTGYTSAVYGTSQPNGAAGVYHGQPGTSMCSPKY